MGFANKVDDAKCCEYEYKCYVNKKNSLYQHDSCKNGNIMYVYLFNVTI